jgi:pyrroline-5-carboxylate reductase
MKVTFLGGGNMARALIGGLVRQGFAPLDIEVVEPKAENRERLVADFGINVCASAQESAWSADLVVLAVKPQQMKEALAPLADGLRQQVVVSIAAGLSLATLSRWLGGYGKIVRCMPNTPALVGAGMTGLCALPDVSLNERLAAERVLAAAGKTVWIVDEARMDAVTALSGSGPAYLFLFIEALQDAAVTLGFSADDARLLAVETVAGSARLAVAADEPVSVLRERVTSKGGTTAAALQVFDERGFKDIVLAAVRAAQARGTELGRQLGGD